MIPMELKKTQPLFLPHSTKVYLTNLMYHGRSLERICENNKKLNELIHKVAACFIINQCRFVYHECCRSWQSPYCITFLVPSVHFDSPWPFKNTVWVLESAVGSKYPYCYYTAVNHGRVKPVHNKATPQQLQG